MLHIHNGDCSAGVARLSEMAGEHIAWREALIDGPVPAGLSSEEWRRARAEHLAKSYGLKMEECLAELLQQEEALEKFSEHEEVVLWFEHDLFCQINLLYLLDWFAQRHLGQTRLSLIFIGEFPGVENFRGLGQLSPTQMASLLEQRREVTGEIMDLAARAWRAYCSPDPSTITLLLAEDTHALPFLRDALLCHLARFPSKRNGLGLIENKALELINAGAGKFGPLFKGFGDALPVYGFGDAQFWNDLRRMIDARAPLLHVSHPNEKNGSDKQSAFLKASFEMTGEGREVLTGQADFILSNGINQWLGGVHLKDDNLWRWDEQKQTVVHAGN